MIGPHRTVRMRSGPGRQVRPQPGKAPVVFLPPHPVARDRCARTGRGPTQGHNATGQRDREGTRHRRQLRQVGRAARDAAGRRRQPEGTWIVRVKEKHPPPAGSPRHLSRQVIDPVRQVGREGRRHPRVRARLGVRRQWVGCRRGKCQLWPGTARGLGRGHAQAGAVLRAHPVVVDRVRHHLVVTPVHVCGTRVRLDHGPDPRSLVW